MSVKNKKKPKKTGARHKIAPSGSVPAGRGATVKLKDGNEVALFNIDGGLYAIENHCPHRGYPIADSRIYGDQVECDLHGWRFSVKTGKCFTKSKCSLESYEVVDEGGWIWVIT